MDFIFSTLKHDIAYLEYVYLVFIISQVLDVYTNSVVHLCALKSPHSHQDGSHLAP